MAYQLIMGNQAYSSWSLRGWLLLRAFGLEFEHRVVPLNEPEWGRFEAEYFPARTVPTLAVDDEHGRFLIWDSLAIAEFLHERHPRHGYWPAAAPARAAARSLCAEMHASFGALRTRMPMNLRREYRNFAPDADTRADIERIERLWHWTRARSGEAGPYLFGERFGAVDAFFAPVASRFRTYRVTLADASQAYCDTLLAHPAIGEFYAAAERERWVMPQNEFDPEQGRGHQPEGELE